MLNAWLGLSLGGEGAAIAKMQGVDVCKRRRFVYYIVPRQERERYPVVQIVLFYYTLMVLLVSIVAAATCLSAYIVARKRTSLLALCGFLFYFFDVALVFQDDFLLGKTIDHSAAFYTIGSPIAFILVGTGLLMSFWLLVCDFLGERRRAMQIVPGIVFVVGSVTVLVAIPAGRWHEFLFFSMRTLMLLWMLGFIAARYLYTSGEVERNRLWRHRRLYALIALLGLAALAENVYFQLMFDPTAAVAANAGMDVLPFLPERNFAENILVLFLAFFACRDSCRSLALRFEKPPTHGSEPLHLSIEHNLPLYCRRCQLSDREGEVLYLVLLGKDNQNIASAMNLAMSTVKVHIHNILQKTGHPNRQELIRDFWRTS